MIAYAEVIGDPIAHSKSPLIHNFWLDALGLEGDYRACHVKAEGLSDYLATRAEDADWRGCNVTLPHKIAVLECVADPGDIRGSIGAANAILKTPDGLIATNTDAAGFLAPIGDLDLTGQPVAVVGSGGAACAVLFALARSGVGPVTLIARNPLKGAALLARFGLKGETRGLDAPLPPASLLVNASSLGMAGQPAYAPDLSSLSDDAIVYDLVYAPLETPLLAAADQRGLECIDGLSMLIGQAALGFELFFGVAPPEGKEEALREMLLR